MKFTSTQELIEYVNIIGDERIKMYEVTFNPISGEEPITPAAVSVCANVYENSVIINSLSDTPTIKAGMDQTLIENILYVDEYDNIPMTCSTGKITFLDRTVLANVCESENGPTIYLNISLNEYNYSNIPFKLKKTLDNDSDYIMLLNPKTLSSNE